MTNNQSRDNFRALITLICFLQVVVKIDADSERKEAYLGGEGRPLLTWQAREALETLKKLLSSPEFKGKNGLKLMEAAKLVNIDISGSALEAFFAVGSPTIKHTFTGAEIRHICNLTQVIHPDSDEGKALGVAQIRALAVINAFKPYLISSRNEIQSGADQDASKSKTYPYKTLNLETIAAIAGRIKMFKSHFGLFLERVIGPLAKYIGELACEGKTNLHILFAKSLTKIGKKPYEKVKAKFDALREKFCKTASEQPKKPLPGSKNALAEHEIPQSKKELEGKIIALESRITTTKSKSEYKGLKQLLHLGIDFLMLRNNYVRFVERHALG